MSPYTAENKIIVNCIFNSVNLCQYLLILILAINKVLFSHPTCIFNQIYVINVPFSPYCKKRMLCLISMTLTWTKRAPQVSHRYGFSPEWMREWVFRLAGRLNWAPHTLQWYGFSPVKEKYHYYYKCLSDFCIGEEATKALPDEIDLVPGTALE